MDTEKEDRHHAATSKRLEELRRQGTTLRSRDLTGGLVIILTVCLVITLSSVFKERFEKNFILSFTSIQYVLYSPEVVYDVLKKLIYSSFYLILPIFCMLLIVTCVSPFLFGGWNFTLEALTFKLDKLNPLTNLPNLFSPKRMVPEIIKSMLKAFFILGVLIYFVTKNHQLIFSLGRYTAKNAIAASYSIIIEFVALLLFAIVFLIIFDLLYNYFQFLKKTRMTTQEVRDEHKDVDGNPEAKRKMRSKSIKLLNQRLNQTVPLANVVITNPNHYAVALRYDENKDRAPKVVAKGKDEIAYRIRMIAISNGVPLYQAAPLARAIYHTANLNAEVHPDLYMSVAIVLSYVQQLRNYQSGRGGLPTYVEDLEIPKEFEFDE